MTYPTPPADADMLALALADLEEAKLLLEVAHDWEDLTAAQAAADKLKLAWISAQCGAGRLLRQAEQARREQGEEECARCHRWYPLTEMVELSSRPDAEDQTRASHWIECRNCREKQDAILASLLGE